MPNCGEKAWISRTIALENILELEQNSFASSSVQREYWYFNAVTRTKNETSTHSTTALFQTCVPSRVMHWPPRTLPYVGLIDGTLRAFLEKKDSHEKDCHFNFHIVWCCWKKKHNILRQEGTSLHCQFPSSPPKLTSSIRDMIVDSRSKVWFLASNPTHNTREDWKQCRFQATLAALGATA